MSRNSPSQSATKVLILLLCTPSIVFAQPKGDRVVSADSPATEARALVTEHIRLFHHTDAKAIAEHTMGHPLNWRRANGKYRILSTADDVEDFFANIFVKLKERDHWARSKTNSLETYLLRKSVVLVDYNFTRKRADGSPIGTYSVIYVVAKADNGWRIIAMYAYDKDKSIRTSLVDRKTEDERNVEALIDKHQRLFNASDAKAISEQSVRAPWQISSSLALTRKDVEARFATLLAGIVERGWERSVKRNLEVYLLRDGLALADYTFSRLDADGNDIMTAGCVFVVGKSDDGWKIISQYGRARRNSLSGRMSK